MIDIFIQRATLHLAHKTALTYDMAYAAAMWHADRWATHCATHGDISPETYASVYVDANNILSVTA